MNRFEREPANSSKPETDSSGAELSDSADGISLSLRIDERHLPNLSPESQTLIQQSVDRLTFLIAKVIQDKEILQRKAGLTHEKALGMLADGILALTYRFAELAGNFEEDDDQDFPFIDWNEFEVLEVFAPHDFYAAYVFNRVDERKEEIEAILQNAQKLGVLVRYWWLSEAMKIGDALDSLIICVHHSSLGEDTALALRKMLKSGAVSWDDLNSAAVEEYRQFGKPITSTKAIFRPDETPLFPEKREEILSYAAWLLRVNEAVRQMAGCGVNDLPSFDYRALYDDEVSPEYAADQALIAAGFSRFE